MGGAADTYQEERDGRFNGLTAELDDLLGLTSPLRERCPYGRPPEIFIDSRTQWTINGIPREKADPGLCQIIITNARACDGCPMNWFDVEKEPSEFLQHILGLDEIIGAGYRGDLPLVEWQALAILKRKRNELEIKEMKERSEKARRK